MYWLLLIFIIATLVIVGCLAPTIRSIGSESYRDVKLTSALMYEEQVAILPTTSVPGIAVAVAGGGRRFETGS